jgi:hypothetical protein
MTVTALATCTSSFDLDEVVQPAPLGDAETASKRARAAHDRIDRLLLGRAGAARKRVHRLLGELIEQDATAPAAIILQSAAECEAAAQAVAARGRVAALLAAS